MRATIKIVSGGQTGVDQGALEAAVQLGLEFGGWAPARWLAEKPLGAIPEAYRGAMREYPDQGSNAQNYRERTKANVRDSHATLILVEKLPLEGGTKLTRDFAASIGRSHHVVDMSAVNAKEDAFAWLRQFLGLSSAFVLNVAGPRESKAPGIQAKTKAFLTEVLGDMIELDENGWPVDREALIGREFVHFKGNRYRLIDFALYTETRELMVVYRALYGERGLWVRPAKMFFESIERDGYVGARFRLADD